MLQTFSLIRSALVMYHGPIRSRNFRPFVDLFMRQRPR